MDFVRYAEGSARLLNTDLASPGALVAILPGREWLHPQVTDKDVSTLRRFQRELRPVFDAAEAGDVQSTIDLLLTRQRGGVPSSPATGGLST